MQKKSLNFLLMKHEHLKKVRWIEIANLGDTTIGRAILEPGLSWEKCVKPIAKTNSCQAPHTQYISER
jgi:hypothetical protein